MKRKLKGVLIFTCFITFLSLTLGGCSSSDSAVSENNAVKTIGNQAETPKDGAAKDEIKKEETKPEETDVNKNDTGKTVIKAISLNVAYPNNSYMIISKKGTVIVADPSEVQEGIKPDIITSTHGHSDHNDLKLYEENKCKTSLYKVENFSVDDVKVFSVASSHNNMINTNDTEHPTNVIYVYEVDGLRIAHMGDVGQDELTKEQLKALGKIDIAFMQFVNSYSGYSLENGKGFKVIEQLKPQIIIPTHSSPEATEKISSIVGKYEVTENSLAISKEDLKDGVRKVVEIKNTLRNK